MNGLPFYKRYPRDFIEGTIGMPFELKTTYSFILDLIYMQGGELPDDPRYISGLLGCSVRKWNLLRDQLISHGKIHVKNNFLTNYRAVSELESLVKHQDKQRENRSRSNKNKDLQKPWTDHTEPEPDTELLPNGNNPPYPQTDLLGEAVASPAATSGFSQREIDQEFDKVWAAYPRKVGKGNARKAWAKARKIASKDEIAPGLWSHIKVWNGGTPKDKIPHLATWLNGERWGDDATAAANRAQNSDEQLDALTAPQEDPLGNDFLQSYGVGDVQGIIAGSVKRIGGNENDQ